MMAIFGRPKYVDANCDGHDNMPNACSKFKDKPIGRNMSNVQVEFKSPILL